MSTQSNADGWLSGSLDRQAGVGLVAFAALLAGTAATRWLAIHDTVSPEAESAVISALATTVVVAVVGATLFSIIFVRDTAGALSYLIDKAAEIEDGDFNVNLESPRDDEAGQVYHAVRMMRDSIVAQLEEVEAAQQEAQEAQREAEARAERLAEQADAMSERFQAAADGDLSVRADEDIDEPALATIAASFNDMIAEMEATVGSARAFAIEVENATEEIDNTATDLAAQGDDVADAIESIAENATAQNGTIQEASSELSSLSASVEEIASSSSEVAEQSEAAVQLGSSGNETATEAVEEMNAIREKTETSTEQVEQLEADMNAIGEIVTLIDDIAEQTNILALNANIEAARAGGSGNTSEGFEVVANEVKGLAEETAEKTDEIERRIAELQTTANETVTEMRETGDRVDRGVKTIERSTELLLKMIEQIEEANNGIQSISDATNDQASSTEQTVALIDEVADLSDQSADEANEVVGLVESQADELSRVTGRIDSLTEQATQLRQQLDSFGSSTNAQVDAEMASPTAVSSQSPGDD